MGQLSNISAGAGQVGAGNYVGRTKWARAYYDFATDGGAIGAIPLRGDKLPKNAVVLSTVVRVETNVASGGAATVSVGVQGATDIRAAATLSTAPALDSTGNKLGAITRATAPVNVSADKDVVATVAVAALTAGRFSVLIEYIELTPNV